MFCAYNRPKAQISGERLQNHWSSGLFCYRFDCLGSEITLEVVGSSPVVVSSSVVCCKQINVKIW